MLTEYALTPHLFDGRHNAGDPQWLDRLRRFGERLLPANPKRACNTVVSDLCDGAWYGTEIVSLIRELERRQDDDRSIRISALDLLKTLRPRWSATSSNVRSPALHGRLTSKAGPTKRSPRANPRECQSTASSCRLA